MLFRSFRSVLVLDLVINQRHLLYCFWFLDREQVHFWQPKRQPNLERDLHPILHWYWRIGEQVGECKCDNRLGTAGESRYIQCDNQQHQSVCQFRFVLHGDQQIFPIRNQSDQPESNNSGSHWERTESIQRHADRFIGPNDILYPPGRN